MTSYLSAWNIVLLAHHFQKKMFQRNTELTCLGLSNIICHFVISYLGITLYHTYLMHCTNLILVSCMPGESVPVEIPGLGDPPPQGADLPKPPPNTGIK